LGARLTEKQKSPRSLRSFGDNRSLQKAAIILAGGFSTRFGQDKGLVRLADKPLINHILDGIAGIIDERILVVSTKAQAENYARVVGLDVDVCVDEMEIHSPLVGALTGFKKVSGDYAILLSSDTPFVSRDVLSLMLALCVGKNAVIPRWPNGYTEPLQGIYQAQLSLKAAKNALKDGKLNMQSMIDKLRRVRYISTLVLQQFDPELKTFFNINTPLDLKKAQNMLNRRNSYSFSLRE
jgi:molybdopterin-guanine dinucleotide biosynthesis protein A